ncbi:hypothetical protein PInf_009349 [Phytophthora infestans]|nr:hypothetical protein PInf_009349 [Phytophthora infestans]
MLALAQRTLEYDLFGDGDSSEEDVVESDEEVMNVVNEAGNEIEPQSEVVMNEPDAVQPLAIVDDPNLVQPGERPEDLAGLDSDDNTEHGSVYDDDDLGPEEPDPAKTVGYYIEHMDARVEAQYAKQKARRLKRPDFQVQTPDPIKTWLEKVVDVSGR